METVVLGIFGLFLVLAVAFLAVPLKTRVMLRVTLDRVDVKISIKPPILSWFLPLPVPGLKGSRAARQNAGSSSTSGVALPTREVSKTREAQETRQASERRSGKPVGLVQRVRSFILEFRTLVPHLRKALVKAARAVSVERLKVVGKIGTGDAYYTALMVGSLNSFIGVTLSIVRRMGVRFLKRPQVRFGPVYQEVDVDLDVDIILAASLWDLLKLGWSLRTI
ncbi:MAG: DUF2953 domain-containing protein [Bacillota bacterium]|jgi:hypothetical protein